MSLDPAKREIYFEYSILGDYAKATAIDAETGVEATVVAPKATSQTQLDRLALNKLRYLLEREDGGPSGRTKPRPGPGFVA